VTVILAPSQEVIPTVSSPEPPSSVRRPISDADMAWLLADAADMSLVGHERTMTMVELGCGDYLLAINRIINTMMSSVVTLPLAIFDRLDAWLDGYVGSPEEPQLRSRVAQVRIQQLQPFRLPAHPVECGAGWCPTR
jgi:hypothetical protein